MLSGLSPQGGRKRLARSRRTAWEVREAGAPSLRCLHRRGGVKTRAEDGTDAHERGKELNRVAVGGRAAAVLLTRAERDCLSVAGNTKNELMRDTEVGSCGRRQCISGWLGMRQVGGSETFAGPGRPSPVSYRRKGRTERPEVCS